MQIRLSSPLQSDSVVDGEGIRTVIWTQGCPHHCPFCHNPETHSFKGGFLKDVSELIEEIRDLELQDGITFSGGDPMMQAKECTMIAQACKEMGYNIWCYTGFLFEDLLEDEDRKEFLNYIDVLVDGKFEIDKKAAEIEQIIATPMNINRPTGIFPTLTKLRNHPSSETPCGQLTDCVLVNTDARPLAIFILAIDTINGGTDQ